MSTSETPNVVFLGPVPIYKSQGETYQKALQIIEVQKEYEKEIAKTPSTPFSAESRAIQTVEKKHAQKQIETVSSNQPATYAYTFAVSGFQTPSGPTSRIITKEFSASSAEDADKQAKAFAEELKKEHSNIAIANIPSQESSKKTFQSFTNVSVSNRNQKLSPSEAFKKQAQEQGLTVAMYDYYAHQPPNIIESTLGGKVPIFSDAYRAFMAGGATLQATVGKTLGVDVRTPYGTSMNEIEIKPSDVGQGVLYSLQGTALSFTGGYVLGKVSVAPIGITMGSVSVKTFAASVGKDVLHGATLTGIEAGITATKNVFIDKKAFDTGFEKIFTPEHVITNIGVSSVMGGVFPSVQTALLPAPTNTMRDYVIRSASAGAAYSFLIAGEGQSQRPIIEASITGGVIGGIVGYGSYEMSSRGYRLIAETNQVRHITNEAGKMKVRQEISGASLGLEKISKEGKIQYWGISTDWFGRKGVYVGTGSEIKPIIGGQTTQSYTAIQKHAVAGSNVPTEMIYTKGMDTKTMQPVYSAFMTTKGISNKELTETLQQKLGKDYRAIVDVLEKQQGMFAGSNVERSLIRADGGLQKDYNIRFAKVSSKSDVDILFIGKDAETIRKSFQKIGIDLVKKPSPLKIEGGWVDDTVKLVGKTPSGAGIDITIMNFNPYQPKAISAIGNYPQSLTRATETDVPSISAQTSIGFKAQTVGYSLVGKSGLQTWEPTKTKYITDIIAFGKTSPSTITDAVQYTRLTAPSSPSVFVQPSISSFPSSSQRSYIPFSSLKSSSKSSSSSVSISSSPVSMSSKVSFSSSSKSNKSSFSSSSSSSEASVSYFSKSSSKSSSSSSSSFSSPPSSHSSSSSFTQIVIIPPPTLPIGFPITGGGFGTRGKVRKHSSNQRWDNLLNIQKASFRIGDTNTSHKTLSGLKGFEVFGMSKNSLKGSILDFGKKKKK